MKTPFRYPLLSSSAALLVVALATSVAAQELPVGNADALGMSSERLQRIGVALQGYVDDGRLPGAAVTVLRRGHVVYDETFGSRDLESADPLRPDAIFRIASQTKALVSVGAMMLQEDGALLLSDPVSRHLPSFRRTTVAVPTEAGGYEVVEADRAITIRDLLTHTAGVGYGGGPGAPAWQEAGVTGWYFADRTEPIRATVDRIATLPFPSQPGQAFVYGYSTDILGAVIEVVSGQPLDVFLRERILEPLDMRDTHFYLPDEKRDRLATVYNLGGALSRAPDGAGMNSQGQYVDGPRQSFSGGAGLLSTTRDYARFLQMLLDDGVLHRTRLLSPTSVALMTQDHLGSRAPAPGMGFGLGFSVRLDVGAAGVHGTVGDFGWGGAYHSTYWVDPVEELVVVYFTQVVPAPGLDDHARLRALVYSAIEESRAR